MANREQGSSALTPTTIFLIPLLTLATQATRVALNAGETKRGMFTLSTDDLAFHNAKMKLVTEPGEFEAWISKDSVSGAPVKIWGGR